MVMSTAVRVENISKRYRLGQRHGARGGVAAALRAAARSPLAMFRPAAEGEGIWALRGVSFDVEHGEVMGIIGRNGAGKSTLLKILSRIVEPDTGFVQYRGRVGSLLEVGTGFHPELTGRENIFLNGAILGMRKAEISRKFDEIVAFAEVEKFIDTPVKRYSSGMYMRLAFAVAAHLEPEILLVDEVLAVGDMAFQKKCLGKMRDVSHAGRTVLFVSHNMSAVNALCSTAVLLDRGAVVEMGDVSRVTERYLALQSGGAAGVGGAGYVTRLDGLDRRIDGFEFLSVDLANPDYPDLGPRTGEPLRLTFTYAASESFVSPAFAVVVRDMYGQEIVRLNTMPISGFPIDTLHASGHVTLTVDSLPLVAGRYTLDVRFVRANVECLLSLDGVVEFDVLPKDVYGSGTALDRSRGLIVVPHRWEHEAAPALVDAGS
jgi:lipopolysaccharide transport system ATP-binding protein